VKLDIALKGSRDARRQEAFISPKDVPKVALALRFNQLAYDFWPFLAGSASSSSTTNAASPL
jgi:hypothetical protein